MRTKLPGEVEYDRWRQMRETPPHRRTRPRDAGLLIRRTRKGYEITAIGGIFGAAPLRTEVPISKRKLLGWSQDIRSVWTRHVVDYVMPVEDLLEGGAKKVVVFQEGWDQSAMPAADFRAIMSELAVAGRDLFRLLFFDDPNDWQRTAIGERLWEISRSKELSMRMASDDFFIPWPMIYTHVGPEDDLDLDGDNFKPEGFWGYQHVIEEEIEYQPFDVAVHPDGNNKIPISINIDSRIKDININDHYEFFEELRVLTCTRRETYDQLKRALTSKTFSDQIVYFLCHGRGAGEEANPNLGSAGVALSDDTPLRDIDLEKWLVGSYLPTEPVVFINACQGGQLSTIFYDSLAKKFLEKRAKGLIGSQIDIPAVFADEYARRFFKKFVTHDDSGPVRIGKIMQGLTREFLAESQNPLGLAYSLYRGIDCFVDWTLSDATHEAGGGS